MQVLDGVLNSPQAERQRPAECCSRPSRSFGYRAGLQQTVDRLEALERANPTNVDANAVLASAQAYAELQNVPKLEAALEKLTKVMPQSPEAWYDLAALKASLGKSSGGPGSTAAGAGFERQRLKHNPKARDLLANARKEPRFAPLRNLPEFKKLVPP